MKGLRAHTRTVGLLSVAIFCASFQAVSVFPMDRSGSGDFVAAGDTIIRPKFVRAEAGIVMGGVKRVVVPTSVLRNVAAGGEAQVIRSHSSPTNGVGTVAEAEVLKAQAASRSATESAALGTNVPQVGSAELMLRWGSAVMRPPAVPDTVRSR